MKQQEKSPQEKIEHHIKDMTDFFISLLDKSKPVPPSVFLFDSKGEAYGIPPNEIDMILTRYKPHMQSMLKSYVKHLNESKGIDIIQSAVFQEVHYKKMDSDQYENSEVKKPSQMEDSKEGFVVSVETKTTIKTDLYEVIFTDDRKHCTVSKEPVESIEIDKDDKENNITSIFTGIIN